MGTKIRILVIDDQEFFRLGLRLGLKDFADICIDSEAADGPAGLALVAERKPDVAIVDIRLPGMNGVDVAEQIQHISPGTRIMLISGFFDDAAVIQGLQLGVDGIITKTDSPRQFACYVRRIHNGIFCCSPSIAANSNAGIPDAASIAADRPGKRVLRVETHG